MIPDPVSPVGLINTYRHWCYKKNNAARVGLVRTEDEARSKGLAC
jgi:hypothetical protein